MGQSIQHRRRNLSAVVHDGLKLAVCRRAVLQLKIGLAAQVQRPELRRGRMIVRPDRLQQFDHAGRFPVVKGVCGRDHRY